MSLEFCKSKFITTLSLSPWAINSVFTSCQLVKGLFTFCIYLIINFYMFSFGFPILSSTQILLACLKSEENRVTLR